MIILGLDTTCDDTSAGIVADGRQVLSNVVASQHASHEPFGGVVPMIAAREHTRQIGFVTRAALEQADRSFQDLDAVAVSNRQGLLLSLVVGVSAAKSIALACDIPLIGIHHLEGHIYSTIMDAPGTWEFPFLCLTVAGGHTLLLRIEDHGDYTLLGHTRDDAAGEAFDKVARRLGLGAPGGASIEREARHGDATAYAFPRPMMHSPDLDFSFSGLKTAVLRALEKPYRIQDICASFQQAVVDVLIAKTIRAAQEQRLPRIALAGGVAANTLLRTQLSQAAHTQGFHLRIAPQTLCMDNGAMVAGAGYHLYCRRGPDKLTIGAYANAPLGRKNVRYRAQGRYR